MHRTLFSRVWLTFGVLPFALLLLYTLDALPGGDSPQAASQHSMWGRRVFCVLVSLVSVVPWIWIDTFRLAGKYAFSSLWKQICLQSRSTSGKRAAYAILSCAALTTGILIASPVPPDPFFPYSSIAIIVGAFAAAFRPPVAIALMPSRRCSAEFLRRVCNSLFPLRTVALIDRRQVGILPMFADEDNLRTPGDWRGFVRSLIDSLPILIVDARFESAAVAEEVQWILESNVLTAKAIAVVTDRDSSPILDVIPTAGVPRIPLAHISIALRQLLYRADASTPVSAPTLAEPIRFTFDGVPHTANPSPIRRKCITRNSGTGIIVFLVCVSCVVGVFQTCSQSRQAEGEFAAYRELARVGDGEVYVLYERFGVEELPPFRGRPWPGCPTYVAHPVNGVIDEHKLVIWFPYPKHLPDPLRSPDHRIPVSIEIQSPHHTSMNKVVVDGRTIPVMQVRACEIFDRSLDGR